jgi:hypothetical protein
MRVMPTVDWRCHVCGHPFVVHNRGVPNTMQVVQDPAACPRCEAPLKSVPPPNFAIGTARAVILALGEGPLARREYGSAVDYLEANVLDEQGVDRILKAALGMDYARWERQLRDTDEPQHEDERLELVEMGRAREAAKAGALAEPLGRVAQVVRDRIQTERKRRLAIAARFDLRRR